MVYKIDDEWVSKKLPKRSIDANKGTFGKVLVVAGSEKYPGAAYLACAAAYRVGAGLVALATDKDTKINVSKKLSEVTFLTFDQVLGKLNDCNVLLIGPGLGQSKKALKIISKLLKKDLPKTIFDGDGLNILSRIDKWWEEINGEVILTPHPGEMSRLSNFSVEEIQKNRQEIIEQSAKQWGKVVVLKGANTIIASPRGKIKISPFANPLLATAGTGDVLSGIIAGMAAQGLDNYDAACVGVYIHGLAGELLKEKFGDCGLLASDLLPILPKVIKGLKDL